MKFKHIISFAALIICFLAYFSSSSASENSAEAPLFNNLGTFHHKISTKNPLAQQFFNQGLVLFYGFEWGESIRSFKEAIRLDPQCGMCYWGLALALGNIMNAPLTGHEYKNAQVAIQKAISLKSHETSVEQDYIQALSLLFQHPPIISTKTGIFSCHVASSQHDESTPKEMLGYSNAMKKLADKNPDDYDAKALYAYALFNRISWNFWDAHGKMNPLTPVIIKTLQSIIDRDPTNIGGNHYFVHVIEQSPTPEKALTSANPLRTLVPGSEHLVHMPTHIYFLTGRYHEGSASNLQAIEAYKQYNKICHAQGFKPEINFLYFHNYDFLRTTAVMEGRKKLALSAVTQMLDKPFSEWLANEASLQWFIPVSYFVKARFGMWNALLSEPMPNSKYQYAKGMWHYAEGMAYAHTGRIKKSEKELLNLQKIIAKGKNNDVLGAKGVQLLKIAYEILAASIANMSGNEKLTLNHLRAADKIQYDMGYHEPPDWYFPVKEILGDAYLKWNRPADAIKMYHLDLKQYPQNGWALYGLSQALRKQNKISESQKIERQFKDAWKYADLPTPPKIF